MITHQREKLSARQSAILRRLYECRQSKNPYRTRDQINDWPALLELWRKDLVMLGTPLRRKADGHWTPETKYPGWRIAPSGVNVVEGRSNSYEVSYDDREPPKCDYTK